MNLSEFLRLMESRPLDCRGVIRVLIKGGVGLSSYCSKVDRVNMKLSEFLRLMELGKFTAPKQKSTRESKTIMYCLEDDSSDTEIILLGSWRNGQFIIKPQNFIKI